MQISRAWNNEFIGGAKSANAASALTATCVFRESKEMPLIRRQRPAVALLFAALMDCAGDGRGLDQNGPPMGSTAGGEPLTVTSGAPSTHLFD